MDYTISTQNLDLQNFSHSIMRSDNNITLFNHQLEYENELNEKIHKVRKLSSPISTRSNEGGFFSCPITQYLEVQKDDKVSSQVSKPTSKYSYPKSLYPDPVQKFLNSKQTMTIEETIKKLQLPTGKTYKHRLEKMRFLTNFQEKEVENYIVYMKRHSSSTTSCSPISKSSLGGSSAHMLSPIAEEDPKLSFIESALTFVSNNYDNSDADSLFRTEELTTEEFHNAPSQPQPANICLESNCGGDSPTKSVPQNIGPLSGKNPTGLIRQDILPIDFSRKGSASQDENFGEEEEPDQENTITQEDTLAQVNLSKAESSSNMDTRLNLLRQAKFIKEKSVQNVNTLQGMNQDPTKTQIHWQYPYQLLSNQNQQSASNLEIPSQINSSNRKSSGSNANNLGSGDHNKVQSLVDAQMRAIQTLVQTKKVDTQNKFLSPRPFFQSYPTQPHQNGFTNQHDMQKWHLQRAMQYRLAMQQRIGFLAQNNLALHPAPQSCTDTSILNSAHNEIESSLGLEKASLCPPPEPEQKISPKFNFQTPRQDETTLESIDKFFLESQNQNEGPYFLQNNENIKDLTGFTIEKNEEFFNTEHFFRSNTELTDDHDKKPLQDVESNVPISFRNFFLNKQLFEHHSTNNSEGFSIV